MTGGIKQRGSACAPGPARDDPGAEPYNGLVGRWLAVLLGFGVGSLAGCLLELDRRAACGDGYHDPEFEGCDPGLPSSFEDECRSNEIARCDPLTCELRCGACGDGVLDPGEACDGNNTRTLPPCQQWTCTGCQVICPRCGNGQVDSDEECDFEFEAISPMPMLNDCADISVPGRPNTYYQAGGNPTCRSDCQWNRSTCNLCGNGQLDDQIIDPITEGPINAAERCDGELFDLLDRFDRCRSACGQAGRDCKATCGEGCLEIQIDPTDSGCCVLPEYPRSASHPCCCEPSVGEAPAYCSNVFDPPIGGGTDDGGTLSPNCPG